MTKPLWTKPVRKGALVQVDAGTTRLIDPSGLVGTWLGLHLHPNTNSTTAAYAAHGDLAIVINTCVKQGFHWVRILTGGNVGWIMTTEVKNV